VKEKKEKEKLQNHRFFILLHSFFWEGKSNEKCVKKENFKKHKTSKEKVVDTLVRNAFK
jgi:hypothetical protein